MPPAYMNAAGRQQGALEQTNAFACCKRGYTTATRMIISLHTAQNHGGGRCSSKRVSISYLRAAKGVYRQQAGLCSPARLSAHRACGPPRTNGSGKLCRAREERFRVQLAHPRRPARSRTRGALCAIRRRCCLVTRGNTLPSPLLFSSAAGAITATAERCRVCNERNNTRLPACNMTGSWSRVLLSCYALATISLLQHHEVQRSSGPSRYDSESAGANPVFVPRLNICGRVSYRAKDTV